ncbi:hypothetical protein [Microtetraspora malaysiensis]
MKIGYLLPTRDEAVRHIVVRLAADDPGAALGRFAGYVLPLLRR